MTTRLYSKHDYVLGCVAGLEAEILGVNVENDLVTFEKYFQDRGRNYGAIVRTRLPGEWSRAWRDRDALIGILMADPVSGRAVKILKWIINQCI
jgi:hypothetical protein